MRGPLSYIGGKNRIAQKIIDILPEHTTYVEPFAGGAQVLFHKKPSKAEILNDRYDEIVNFYRVCQLHHQEFLRYMEFSLVSRKWFDLFKSQDPSLLTDIQRACRFFYLQKNGFAGLVNDPTYTCSVESPRSWNPATLESVIKASHERLARVQIENRPYEEILERFDRPATLFYLDPPYWGKDLYRFNFTTEDFDKLEERLRKLKGKFVLSLNDLPEVRALFHRFRLREIEISYTAQKEAGKRYPELLITNFT
ncbi:MAG TPA: DNA adenine methylase [Bryobacteraceae bacterium]|nr:DNA adenine methylase [Bryobacteraceae bacterium]